MYVRPWICTTGSVECNFATLHHKHAERVRARLQVLYLTASLTPPVSLHSLRQDVLLAFVARACTLSLAYTFCAFQGTRKLSRNYYPLLTLASLRCGESTAHPHIHPNIGVTIIIIVIFNEIQYCKNRTEEYVFFLSKNRSTST